MKSLGRFLLNVKSDDGVFYSAGCSWFGRAIGVWAGIAGTVLWLLVVGPPLLLPWWSNHADYCYVKEPIPRRVCTRQSCHHILPASACIQCLLPWHETGLPFVCRCWSWQSVLYKEWLWLHSQLWVYHCHIGHRSLVPIHLVGSCHITVGWGCHRPPCLDL